MAMPTASLGGLRPCHHLTKPMANFFTLYFYPVSGFAAPALWFSNIEWGREGRRSLGGNFTEKKKKKLKGSTLGPEHVGGFATSVA